MSNKLIPPQATELVTHQSMEIPPLTGPSHADWEHHRPLITQLYRDEGKKLKEVIAIMLQHNHKASPRTFKNWIKRWGLDKKNKERDMVAIVRKKNQRDAIGKKSSFRVRGQVVTAEQVDHYFKRKKITTNIEVADAPTPSDISCRTPSPQKFENDGQPFLAFPSQDSQVDTYLIARLTSSPKQNSNVGPPELTTGNNDLSLPFEFDNNILQLNVKDVYNILSENLRVSRSPSPPRALLLPERLLFAIKSYYDNLLDSGTLPLYIDNWFGSSKAIGQSPTEIQTEFWAYCVLAINLNIDGAYVESRRALSKMFNKVDDIIRFATPLGLDLLLQVFLLLNGKGYTGILKVLRSYIYAMTNMVITNNSRWNQICKLISTYDEELLREVLIESWKCVIAGSSKILGPLHSYSIQNYLNFIDTVYDFRDLMQAEILLRNLLSQCEAESTSKPEHIYKILQVLGNNLYKQRRYAEAEIIALDGLSHTQETNQMRGELNMRALIAWSQYSQGKSNLAEVNMRYVIAMGINIWGRTAPLTVRSIHILEIWLRGWGRGEEADQLKARFDEFLGLDEIDLEMAQAQ